MANYQGQYVFKKSDKTMLMWTEEGELSSDFTAIPPPTADHQWQDGRWIIADNIADKLKAQAQAQIWEAIKQKRHANTRGGVFIKSVGKWFHNDDPSRTQYLALQVLSQLPDNLMWKTMDNEFVLMTKDLLNEIAMTMLAEEQADFANAEKHRLAMLKVDNPLEYDYSTGWSQTHGQ